MFKSTALAAVMVTALLASPAAANIRCDGAYQIVNGKPVSTPYCQDEDLAAHARLRGANVSGDQIRNSTDTKRRVCVATNDTACASINND